MTLRVNTAARRRAFRSLSPPLFYFSRLLSGRSYRHQARVQRSDVPNLAFSVFFSSSSQRGTDEIPAPKFPPPEIIPTEPPLAPLPDPSSSSPSQIDPTLDGNDAFYANARDILARLTHTESDRQRLKVVGIHFIVFSFFTVVQLMYHYGALDSILASISAKIPRIEEPIPSSMGEYDITLEDHEMLERIEQHSKASFEAKKPDPQKPFSMKQIRLPNLEKLVNNKAAMSPNK